MTSSTSSGKSSGEGMAAGSRTGSQTGTQTGTRSPLAAAQRFLERWGVLVAFGLLVVASTILQGGDFLNPENFRTLLNSNAAVGVLAVGMTLVIVSADIGVAVDLAPLGQHATQHDRARRGRPVGADRAQRGHMEPVATVLGAAREFMPAVGEDAREFVGHGDRLQ